MSICGCSRMNEDLQNIPCAHIDASSWVLPRTLQNGIRPSVQWIRLNIFTFALIWGCCWSADCESFDGARTGFDSELVQVAGAHSVCAAERSIAGGDAAVAQA